MNLLSQRFHQQLTNERAWLHVVHLADSLNHAHLCGVEAQVDSFDADSCWVCVHVELPVVFLVFWLGRNGGLADFQGLQVHCASVNRSEEVKQRLDGLNTRVLAAAVDELADEAECYAGVFRNSFEARCAGIPKPTLQVICNGFNGGCHGS